MRPDSIRARVVIVLVTPLILIALANVYFTWRNAVETASLIADRTLAASALAIAERVRVSEDGVEALIPPSALSVFSGGDEVERILYQVRAPSGDLVAGDPDVVTPNPPPRPLATQFYDAVFRGQPVRQVVYLQPLIGGETGSAMVIVGATLKARDAMVRRLWLQSLRNELLLVAAAALLSVIGLGFGLRPLLRFAHEVAAREPDELDAFDVGDLPRELRPLGEALNGAFDRVRLQIAAQRRFISNAAHQLRTPLSILKTQASYGIRENSLEASQEVLRAQEKRIDQMSRLVSQLLSLARAEQGVLLLKAEVDFATLTREVLEDLTTTAISRDIDLSYDEGDGAMIVEGHASLLKEIVVNLVDNALRYTPPGGQVAVMLRRVDGEIELTIEDSGPGVAPEDLARLSERFYRTSAAGLVGDGSGLGLAIVKEIAEAHSGALRLGNRESGTGLAAMVSLPVS